MNRTGLQICEKPEPARSGFFITALLLCTAVFGQEPSVLLGELLWDRSAAATGPAAAADTSQAPWRAFLSAGYDDLYHRRATDTGSAKTISERADASLARATGGVSFCRNAWGVAAEGKIGSLAAVWSGRDDGYAVRGGATFNSFAFAGWYDDRFATFRLDLGYDDGLPFEYHRHHPRYSDPHLIQGAALSVKLENARLTLYETGRPLLNASARIEKTSNKAFVEMPLAAALWEIGGIAERRYRRDTTRFMLASMRISSDTSLSGKNVLPSEVTGSGYRCAYTLFLPDLPGSPRAEVGLISLSALVRGYDEGHTASGRAEYCDLDTCGFLFIRGTAGATIPARVRCGASAEYFHCGTTTHGLFDPSISTPFSYFNPTKYRVDSLGQRYVSAGLFAQRPVRALRRQDSAGVRLDASYVRMEGSIDTREYDFTFLIPRLINPHTWAMADEKLLLLVPALRYTFHWRRLSCTASLRQLVPIDISGKWGGAAVAAPAAKKTVWGGTLARMDAVYCW